MELLLDCDQWRTLAPNQVTHPDRRPCSVITNLAFFRQQSLREVPQGMQVRCDSQYHDVVCTGTVIAYICDATVHIHDALYVPTLSKSSVAVYEPTRYRDTTATHMQTYDLAFPHVRASQPGARRTASRKRVSARSGAVSGVVMNHGATAFTRMP